MTIASLELESDPSPVRRAARHEFSRSYAEVVDLLVSAGMNRGVDSEQRVKRWMKYGRAAGDLPPLDDLHLMAAWWRRLKAAGHLKWRVPDFLIALERGAASVPAVPVPVAGGDGPPEVPAVSEVEALTDEIVVDDEHAEAALKQLRAFARSLQADMSQARETKNDSRFWEAYERYGRVSEQIRKWEKTALEMKRARGDMVDVAKEREAISQVLGVSCMSFSNVLVTLGRVLAPEKDDAAIRDLVMPLRDRCFAHLKSTGFRGHFTPAEITIPQGRWEFIAA